MEYTSGAELVQAYESSPSHSRLFCKRCGSSLGVELEAEPDQIYLAMGTIEGSPELPPGYHIYVDSRAPWHEILDDLPQYATEPEE